MKGVATVPVIYAASGNCHVYVDATAVAGRCAGDHRSTPSSSAPSVCNAAETLLVHSAVADEFLPAAFEALAEAGVELRADSRVRGLAPASVDGV